MTYTNLAPFFEGVKQARHDLDPNNAEDEDA